MTLHDAPVDLDDAVVGEQLQRHEQQADDYRHDLTDLLQCVAAGESGQGAEGDLLKVRGYGLQVGGLHRLQITTGNTAAPPRSDTHGGVRYHCGVNIRIAPRIATALADNRPVVALESTVITHGLPSPSNLELARNVEAEIRAQGAEPATVGILAGEAVIGLSEAETEQLSGADADKASLWNLPALLEQGRSAGTTVATTLQLAASAGISVFATGGIGGVHPAPYDESTDLTALGRYPLVTVCAGPKSILDVPATLQRLETLGVSVVGYRSDRLAGFHVPLTDHPLPARAESPAELARIFRTQQQLGLPGGLLVSNPVSEGMDPAELARIRDEAEQAAAEAGIRGKDTTPWLLDRIASLSEGRTVEVNLRLLRENAALAARIAVALTELE